MASELQEDQIRRPSRFPTAKVGIVVALAVAVAAAIALKGQRSSGEKLDKSPLPSGTTRAGLDASSGSGSQDARRSVPLPRLVDLGAGRCIPCKMMAPILEELKVLYGDKLQVEVLDVWENPAIGRQYKIRLIPTQIFYDASGRELFRHEGFMSRENIVAKWKELGVDLEKGSSGDKNQ